MRRYTVHFLRMIAVLSVLSSCRTVNTDKIKDDMQYAYLRTQGEVAAADTAVTGISVEHLRSALTQGKEYIVAHWSNSVGVAGSSSARREVFLGTYASRRHLQTDSVAKRHHRETIQQRSERTRPFGLYHNVSDTMLASLSMIHDQLIFYGDEGWHTVDVWEVDAVVDVDKQDAYKESMSSGSWMALLFVPLVVGIIVLFILILPSVGTGGWFSPSTAGEALLMAGVLAFILWLGWALIVAVAAAASSS